MTLDRLLAWVGAVGVPLGILFTWIAARHYYKRSDKKRTPTFVVQSTVTLSEAVLLAWTA
jgi:hypothetical protein